MFSLRRIVFTLVLTAVLLPMVSRVSCAQQEEEASQVNQLFESDEEMLRKVEKDVQLLVAGKVIRNPDIMTLRAERQLKKILELFPNTFLHDRVEENLFQVQELLGEHQLQIAYFYFNRRGGRIKGAESRLLQIAGSYPKFSRMDEVLLLLGKVYLKGDQPLDAANYLWELVLKYPKSKYLNEAFEQFGKVGVNASNDCDNSKP